MNRELLEAIRKSCLWMSLFGAAFVLIYAGLVLFSKFAYFFFRGLLPGADRLFLRAVFYGLSAVSVAANLWLGKARYSRQSLKKAVDDNYRLAKYLLMTSVMLLSLSVAPLIAGFCMFFLAAMYADFFILAAASIVLIFINVPKVDFWERKIREAGGPD